MKIGPSAIESKLFLKRKVKNYSRWRKFKTEIFHRNRMNVEVGVPLFVGLPMIYLIINQTHLNFFIEPAKKRR